MRKTISLKLTRQEEDIIGSIRKEGISPSAFIREAFWNSVHEKESKNMVKGYKEVNQVNHFCKEEVNQGDGKVYNVVNQVNQKVNQRDDFLQEKVVNQQVNLADQSQSLFLDHYIHQLNSHIQQLENELHDWKMRYSAEIQYWKGAYQSLQGEYQDQVKDSTKRIDEKFDRIMFYIEESRKSPLHAFELPSLSDTVSEKQKKRSTSQMFRM